MSSIAVDEIFEHTPGAGVTIDGLKFTGFVIQPDQLETNTTVPSGSTMFADDTLDVADGITLDVIGTVVVR